MSICRTDDPIADFNNWDAEQQRELEKYIEKLPRCSECDQPIQEDDCYEFNDELICSECLDNNHRKRVEDYVS